jgi:hypothetical protein
MAIFVTEVAMIAAIRSLYTHRWVSCPRRLRLLFGRSPHELGIGVTGESFEEAMSGVAKAQDSRMVSGGIVDSQPHTFP